MAEAVLVDSRERHWRSPFGFPGLPAFTAPPPRAIEATQRAWTGLEEEGPDQVAPGLTGLYSALVVRNLALTLPGRPPLIVHSTGQALTRAYHSILVPVLGRWASRYPMYYWAGDAAVPLSRRGLPRGQTPRPIVIRSFSTSDLEALLTKFPEARVLVLADGPANVPVRRPLRCHVIVRSTVAFHDEDVRPLRTPCRFLPPQPHDVADASGEAAVPLLAESNGHRAAVDIVPIVSQDVAIAELMKRFLALARADGWRRFPGFTNVARSFNLRVQCALFAAAVAPEAGLGSMAATLEAMMRTGVGADGPEVREFVFAARSQAKCAAVHQPAKVTWFEGNAGALSRELFTIAVESRAAQEAGRVWARSNAKGLKVQRMSILKEPVTGPLLLPGAPLPRILEQVVTGVAAHTRILLYPWEAPLYNASRAVFLRSARRLGVMEWPILPEADEPFFRHDAPTLLPTQRAPDIEAGIAEPVVDADTSVAVEEAERAHVVVRTTMATHRFPAERIVIVLRGGKFVEVPAAEGRRGDTLVASATGTPSAHRVVRAICRRNPEMENTRVMASQWRRLLRDHIAQKYPGQRLAAVHAAMKPGVQYQQFRSWVLEDEPITPQKGNLFALMESLGMGRPMAAVVHQAALDHKADRLTIYRYLLYLSKNRLDEIYRENEEATDEDRPQITVEDLAAVIQFETIQDVEKSV